MVMLYQRPIAKSRFMDREKGPGNGKESGELGQVLPSRFRVTIDIARERYIKIIRDHSLPAPVICGRVIDDIVQEV
jgi:hypothetical protein